VLIATGSSDKTIRVYEIVVGECQRLLLGHSDYISCLEFHMGNPNILASACKCIPIIYFRRDRGQINLFPDILLAYLLEKSFLYL